MDLHLVLDRSVALRAQLERELREAIRSGRLAARTKLPPSRMLADDLRISRGVVVEAYSQLIAEGYLVARPGDGTRVADAIARQPPAAPLPPAVASRVRYELRSGVPDLSLFPRRDWQAATIRAMIELPDAALAYGSRRGSRSLRSALTEYLGRVRAVVAEPDRVFVTTGCAHGMTILWRALGQGGARRVGIEDPAWSLIPESVVQAGLEPVPIAVDGDGLIVDEARLADVDAVVLSPAHQYPTGAVLTAERRSRLIAWARERGAVIVEDDYDAEYRYDREPIASLQGLAPDCVVYAGSTSKTLAPALRLGWLVVPSHLVGEIASQQGVAHAMPGVLVQAAYATMLADGAVDRHLRRTRRRYRARRDALAGALERFLPWARIGGASAGLHLIAWLPPDRDERAIASEASKRGVAIDTLHEDCAVATAFPPALVLGYGFIDEHAIPLAIEELAGAADAAG